MNKGKILLMVVLVGIALCGCINAKTNEKESDISATENSSKVISNNPLFDDNSEVDKIMIYAFEDENPIIQVTDKKEVEEIMSMFNNWDMEAAEVSEEDILDLDCFLEVYFSEELRVGYHPEGKDDGYYGTINGKPYYLPQQFAEYLDSVYLEGK